jgi:guanyl-specific ribonuclease Sa
MFSAAWLIEANGRRAAALLLALAIAFGTCDGAPSPPIAGNQSAFGQERAGLPSSGGVEDPAARAQPPRKAVELLSALNERHGVPLPGYVGGREFKNRERRLPRGRYREYDVNPKVRGQPRDAERIVIEQRTGKAYYTDDHYRTFVPLN